MSTSSAFLAVDWGTTNRRVFRFEDGTVAHTERDDCGAASVTDFASEVAAIRERSGDLPMLLAGMVGSTVGWRVVPYVAAPAGIDELVAGLDWIDDRTAIVPGVSCSQNGRADVMRGEEVQLLGAVAGWMSPPDAPADGRADHAREQHRQVAEALADRRDCAREVADRRSAAVVALGMRDRAAFEAEHAPVGRAPVDGEKGGRRAHHQVA